MGLGGSKHDGPFAVWGEPGPDDARLGVSPILKSILAPDVLATKTSDSLATVWELVYQAFKKFRSAKAVGSRKLLKRELVPSSDGKKQFEKLTLATEFSWLTYEELEGRVARIASAFVTEKGMRRGDRVLIFAETQMDWMVCMLACFRQGATVVTAYATLGEEGVSTSLNQSKASICVCDGKLFKVVQKAARNCPGLKFVVPILTAGVDEMTTEQMQEALGPNITVRSTHQLDLIGSRMDAVAPSPPDPQDLAVLMYTSGTTGASKGVMITHENIVSQGFGLKRSMDFVNHDTVYIAYLPLAHIMELFIECSLIYLGGMIGYGSPQTLTDTGVKLAKGQQGDAPLLKPTLMVFAPAVMDKVYSGVKDKVAKAGGLTETVFNQALAAGYRHYDAGKVGCGMAGNVVMHKAVQSLIGGHVTHIITGSAPLSAEIQKFAQSCFNCPVRQGYGLTETCAASTVGDMHDNTPGQVGPPTPSTYVRLRDWPEGGYTNADLYRQDIKRRRGEVLIGGPTVALGYLVDPEHPDAEIVKKNEEEFITIEGVRYFCSGDVGQINERGCVQIIDRKKDLFKGANGEYVSLSKVEACLTLSPHVEMPMVYGRTGATGVIALISPNKHAIEEIAKEKGIDGNFMELCKNKDVIAEVSKSCLKECKAGGLNAFEIPTAIALCGTQDGMPAWTPDNDMLTTTMKLKRPIIAKTFSAEIDDAYARSA